MEPKGNHLMEHDRRKQDFLEEISGQCRHRCGLEQARKFRLIIPVAMG